ncbi:YybH family protein [Candidatus Latescibacterota bacterium]
MRATLLVLALAIASCQPAQRSAQEAEADVDAVRSEWQSLANADDADAVAAMYTEGATFVAASGTVVKGREAIRGAFEASFSVRSDLVIETAAVLFDEDMVAAYGNYSQKLQSPDGETTLKGMWQTVSMYQPDGSLKIVLHQSMIPAEPSM